MLKRSSAMRKTTLLLVFLAPLLLAAQQTATPVPDLPALFHAQMQASTQQGFTYTKTVALTNGSGTTEQTRRFTVAHEGSDGQDVMMRAEGYRAPFMEELERVLEYYFADAPLSDFFLLAEQDNRSVIASRLPKSKDKTDLAQQAYLVDENGVLRMLSASIQRRSWLYDTDYSIEIHFDAQGRYSHHTVHFSSDIFLVARDKRTTVTGQAAYGASN